tara:strand:+ start:877 stop:1473 length:597 start_codon:yes stop_codon:yes gene_type:complete
MTDHERARQVTSVIDALNGRSPGDSLGQEVAQRLADRDRETQRERERADVAYEALAEAARAFADDDREALRRILCDRNAKSLAADLLRQRREQEQACERRLFEALDSLAEARDALAAERSVLAMAVSRLGGHIEECYPSGKVVQRPTHRGNFLQRIDDLRRKERKLDDAQRRIEVLTCALEKSSEDPVDDCPRAAGGE